MGYSLVDCTECGGSGKVPLIGYRDSAALAPEGKPKMAWKSYVSKVLLVALIGIGGVSIVAWGVPKVLEANKQAELDRKKQSALSAITIICSARFSSNMIRAGRQSNVS